MEGYAYDLFVSYRRTPNVREWVRNHLVPRLSDALADELEREPRIFMDAELEVGVRWPDRLVWALQRSRLMLAVWSPPYFTSAWCMAEWQTMLRREQLVGMSGRPAQPGLVYPIRYSDGHRFPAAAQNVQQEMIFSEWRYPYPQFADSPKYLDFHDAVVELAERLARRLDDTPAWRPDWPSVFPGATPPSPATLPRL